MYSPADGKKHLYFVFLLQICLLNMLPHLVARVYVQQKMRDWPIGKYKMFENALFLTHSVLVFFSFILGIFAYNAGTLMNAIPGSGFFM